MLRVLPGDDGALKERAGDLTAAANAIDLAVSELRDIASGTARSNQNAVGTGSAKFATDTANALAAIGAELRSGAKELIKLADELVLVDEQAYEFERDGKFSLYGDAQGMYRAEARSLRGHTNGALEKLAGVHHRGLLDTAGDLLHGAWEHAGKPLVHGAEKLAQFVGGIEKYYWDNPVELAKATVNGLEIVAGALLAGVGVAGEGAGLALDATGVGIPAGAAAAVASAGAIAAGAGLMAAGASGIGQNVSHAMGEAADNMSEGSVPSPASKTPLGKPLTPEEVAANEEYVRGLPTEAIKSKPGPAREYELRVNGGRLEQPNVAPKNWGRDVFPDDIDVQEGMLVDAKYRGTASSSFHVPESVDPKMKGFVSDEITRRLLIYKQVLDSPGVPLRGLRIVTNDEEVAAVYRGLMKDLDVPGEVRIMK